MFDFSDRYYNLFDVINCGKGVQWMDKKGLLLFSRYTSIFFNCFIKNIDSCINFFNDNNTKDIWHSKLHTQRRAKF